MSAAPNLMQTRPNVHTISLFVNNQPGVLVRVALVFSINNNFLGMVRQWQNMFFENRLSDVPFLGQG